MNTCKHCNQTGRPAHRFLAIMLAACGLASAQTPIPSTWSYPGGSGDSRGFTGNMRQARKDTGLTATIARGNAQLRDEEIDPQTTLPYDNTAVKTDNPDVGTDWWIGEMALNPDGSFALNGVINYSTDINGVPIDEGNFTSAGGFPDAFYPGLPGETALDSLNYTNGANFSVEFVGFISLPAGQTTLSVRHDDAFQLAFHPNDARDIFRRGVLEWGTNTGFANRSVTLDVAQAGLYSFRLMTAQWNGTHGLEFYSGADLVNGAAPAELALLPLGGTDFELSWVGNGTLQESMNLANFSTAADQRNPQGRSAAGGGHQFFRVLGEAPIPVYQALTVPTRPYVTGISPGNSESGVDPAVTIEFTMENRNGAGVGMTVGGVSVTPTIIDNGSTSTVTYTPPAPFAAGETVPVTLTYGSASAEWAFFIETGQQVLLFGNTGVGNPGDIWVANRLATEFGFDVVVRDSATVDVTEAVNLASTSKLVYVSSKVLGSNTNSVAVFQALAPLDVPIIMVEQASVGDIGMGTPGGSGPTDKNIYIVDNTHPAGNPALGTFQTHALLTVNANHHRMGAPATGDVIGEVSATDARALWWVAELGTDLGGTPAPARRAFLGFLGDDGAASLTAEGLTLWDNTITWMLETPPGP